MSRLLLIRKLTQISLGIALFLATVYICMLLFNTGALVSAFSGSAQQVVTVRFNLDGQNNTELQDAIHGFQDGVLGRPKRTSFFECVAEKPADFPATSYQVLTDPSYQVLRYQEPSLLKRVLLLWLGATHNYLSLSMAVLLGGTAWLLWGLVKDVTPATPFTRHNARRLQYLGLLIVVLNLWQEVSYYMIRALIPAYHVKTQLIGAYVDLNNAHQIPGWNVGLVICLIALVYQRGVELQQEAELTV